MKLRNAVRVLDEENMICNKTSQKNEQGFYRLVQEVFPGLHDLMGQTRDVVPEAIKLCDPWQGSLVPKGFEAFWAQAARLVASVETALVRVYGTERGAARPVWTEGTATWRLVVRWQAGWNDGCTATKPTAGTV